MNIPGTASKFEPLGADQDTLDGLNIHAAIVDELHAHKTADVWDVLNTATAARRQPLMFAITTAGFNRQSVCWRQHEYCEKVLEDIRRTIRFSPYRRSRCEGRLGRRVDVGEGESESRRQCEARRSAPQSEARKSGSSALNSFLRLHRNQWTTSETRWMPLDKWNACAGFRALIRN
jgi:phage terminase large subunit-like protein